MKIQTRTLRDVERTSSWDEQKSRLFLLLPPVLFFKFRNVRIFPVFEDISDPTEQLEVGLYLTSFNLFFVDSSRPLLFFPKFIFVFTSLLILISKLFIQFYCFCR